MNVRGTVDIERLPCVGPRFVQLDAHKAPSPIYKVSSL